MDLNNLLLLGFKFVPTDEVLFEYYLRRKIQGYPSQNPLIMEFDVYRSDPETISETVLGGGTEAYFLTPRKQKYKNGGVVDRSAGDGFWRTSGCDQSIHSKTHGGVLGKKRALKFYRGTLSERRETDWLMLEYEMQPCTENGDKFQDLILCKIYRKCSKKVGEAPAIEAPSMEAPAMEASPQMPLNATNLDISDTWGDELRSNLFFDTSKMFSLLGDSSSRLGLV